MQPARPSSSLPGKGQTEALTDSPRKTCTGMFVAAQVLTPGHFPNVRNAGFLSLHDRSQQNEYLQLTYILYPTVSENQEFGDGPCFRTLPSRYLGVRWAVASFLSSTGKGSLPSSCGCGQNLHLGLSNAGPEFLAGCQLEAIPSHCRLP